MVVVGMHDYYASYTIYPLTKVLHGYVNDLPCSPFPIFPGKFSKRENQWERVGDSLLEGIMMTANDIKTQDIPMPLGTYNTV